MKHAALAVTVGIALIIGIVLICSFLTEFQSSAPSRDAVILDFEEFSVQDEHTGTQITGICYASTGKDKIVLEIIGHVHVSETDVAGVEVLFPKGVSVTDIRSGCGLSSDDIALFRSSDYPHVTSFVEIGRSWLLHDPINLEGAVTIIAEVDKVLHEELTIRVGAGSYVNPSGNMVFYPTFKDLKMSLNDVDKRD